MISEYKHQGGGRRGGRGKKLKAAEERDFSPTVEEENQHRHPRSTNNPQSGEDPGKGQTHCSAVNPTNAMGEESGFMYCAKKAELLGETF